MAAPTYDRMRDRLPTSVGAFLAWLDEESLRVVHELTYPSDLDRLPLGPDGLPESAQNRALRVSLLRTQWRRSVGR